MAKTIEIFLKEEREDTLIKINEKQWNVGELIRIEQYREKGKLNLNFWYSYSHQLREKLDELNGLTNYLQTNSFYTEGTLISNYSLRHIPTDYEFTIK